MNYKMPKTLIDVLKHLYKLADDFPYSQLALCLDQNNLFDLLRVFGGQKLYIPTVEEFTQLVQFCLVEEIGDYKEAIAINPEVLDGFTEAKYKRISNKLYTRVEEGKRKKRNRNRKNKSDTGTDSEEAWNKYQDYQRC